MSTIFAKKSTDKIIPNNFELNFIFRLKKIAELFSKPTFSGNNGYKTVLLKQMQSILAL